MLLVFSNTGLQNIELAQEIRGPAGTMHELSTRCRELTEIQRMLNGLMILIAMRLLLQMPLWATLKELIPITRAVSRILSAALRQ